MKVRASSCLDNYVTPVVLDASVLININASGFAEAIIGSLGRPVLVTTHTQEELERGRAYGYKDAEMLETLCDRSLVRPVALSVGAEDMFQLLVRGIALASLADGEASSLAHAHDADCIAVIDERKARNIAKDHFPKLRLACTCDILLCSAVQLALGPDNLRTALRDAITYGKMHVRESWSLEVAELVGENHMRSSPSTARALGR